MMEDRTLTIIKESKIGHDDWYEIKLNDRYVFGSYSFQKAMEVYNQIKENKDVNIMTKEILFSEKI